MNFQEVKSLIEIPKDKYLIYALSVNDKYVVLGRGKYNRAKVIFDDIENISYNHIKSFKVRLYHLFTSNLKFKREIIIVNSINQAKKLEKEKHKYLGGNSLVIDRQIEDRLFNLCKDEEIVTLLLRIALRSSFSGLYDLRKWYKEKIISEFHWKKISNILQLPKE